MEKYLTFIMSGGRTGTKFLGDFLSKHIEQSYSVHEPDILYGINIDSLIKIRTHGLWNTLIGRAIGRSGVRVIGSNFISGKWSATQTRRAIISQRSSYHRSIDRPLLIESYYAWWMVADILPYIYPNLSMVGIVRDPRTWIESWRARSPTRARGHWSHHLPPGPLTAKLVRDERWESTWNELSEVGKLAWQWNCINSHLLSAQRQHGLSLFTFEEIFDGPATAFRKLCESASTFAGRKFDIVEFDPSFLQQKSNASSVRHGSWRSWNQKEREEVRVICGDLMAEFGYPPLN